MSGPTGRDRSLRAILLAWMVMLYAPLAVVVLFSFNDSKRGAVWRGFSLRHYEAMLGNSDLVAAFANSLLVAAASAAVATALGAGAALALERSASPAARSAHAGLLVVPLVVPEICLGIGMLMLLRQVGWPPDLGWPLSLGAVAAAHVTFTVPFCAAVVRARLRQLDPAVEAAAADLGAGRWRILATVTLPQIKTALAASFLLGVTVSLDDFIVTFFTAGATTNLLPLRVFSMVRFGDTPQVNAASTLLVALTFAAVAAAFALSRKR